MTGLSVSLCLQGVQHALQVFEAASAGLLQFKGETAVGAEALNAGRKNRNGDRVRRHHERSAQRIHYAFRAVRASMAVADVFENDENNALIGGGAGLREPRNGKVPVNVGVLTQNLAGLIQGLRGVFE